MLALAEARISSQITRIAGRSVQRALLSHRGQQLTQREQFDGESPTILMIDPVLLNDLRFSVVDAVNEAVTAMKQEDLDIPLGSVTGLELLSGLGPGVPVHILSVASVTAEYHSEFQEAGINQTLHRMLLDVVVRIKLLLPGCRTELSVGVPICISETVIVGNTPYYQNLYR